MMPVEKKVEFSITDAEIERIRRETEEREKHEPYAESVRYDATSGAVKVTLRGGSVIVATARGLRGLADATDAQLADVRVFDGRALFWDALDVQHSLIAFLSETLGLLTAQTNARRGGSARTPAKAAAARANGAKGGRPKTLAS